MNKYIFLALIALAPASAARAQGASAAAPAAKSQWTAKVSVATRPLVGRNDPFDGDVVDESDAEIFYRLDRPLGGWINLRLQAGLTTAPTVLDDRRARSGYYAQISVGEAEGRLTAFREFGGANAGMNLEDTLLPYLRYRYSRGFDGYLDDHSFNDQRLTAGLRYRDVRGIMCSEENLRERQRNRDASGLCNEGRGLYYDLEGSVNVVYSSNPDRERVYPTARLQVVSRPLFAGIRLYGEGYAEFSYFQNERVAGGELREDRLWRATVGADLSALPLRWFGLERGIELWVGIRREENDSNRPDKRYARWSFAPSVSFTHTF